MNLLESLAGGLRGAAGVLSPAAQQITLRQDEQAQQQAQQRKQVMAAQLIKAAEMGAIEPEAAQRQLQALGYGQMPVGPSMDVQKQRQAMAEQARYRAALAAAGADPVARRRVAEQFASADALLKMKTEGGFTLKPDEIRFGADGSELARGNDKAPGATDKTEDERAMTYLLGIKQRVDAGVPVSPQDLTRAQLVYDRLNNKVGPSGLVNLNLGGGVALNPSKMFGAQALVAGNEQDAEAIARSFDSAGQPVRVAVGSRPQGSPAVASPARPTISDRPPPAAKTRIRVDGADGIVRMVDPQDGSSIVATDEAGQPLKSPKADNFGSREATFLNRVLVSAAQVNKALKNIVELPMTTSGGVFGGRQQGKSLFEAGKETLVNTMTTQEVQSYNTFATGITRALAGIESSGLAPPASLTHLMSAVLFKEGDTNRTKLEKLAETRQVVEAGMETVLANPRVPQETRDYAQKLAAELKATIPFTPRDVMRLNALHMTNPNATLRDVMEKQSTAAPGLTPAEAKRLQELEKKYGSK